MYDFTRRKPDRTIVLGAEEWVSPGGWLGELHRKGFKIIDGDKLPLARVTEYPGVAIYVEQWDYAP